MHHERRNIPERRALVNEPRLDVVIGAASGTDDFLTNKSSRSQVSKIEATEGADRVALPIVSRQDDLVCGVKFVFVEGVGNRNLDHLTIFEKVDWAKRHRTILLVRHLHRSFADIGVFNLSQVFNVLVDVIFELVILKIFIVWVRGELIGRQLLLEQVGLISLRHLLDIILTELAPG